MDDRRRAFVHKMYHNTGGPSSGGAAASGEGADATGDDDA